MPAPTHGKGWLQEAILKVFEAVEAGKIKLDEGKTLTPTACAKIIAKTKKVGGKPVDQPSSGAVSACYDRLADYGLIKLHDKPKAFAGFTAKGKKESAESAVLARREERKAQTAANKPAKKAAAKKAPAKKAAANKGGKTTKGGKTAKKAAAKKVASKPPTG